MAATIKATKESLWLSWLVGDLELSCVLWELELKVLKVNALTSPDGRAVVVILVSDFRRESQDKRQQAICEDVKRFLGPSCSYCKIAYGRVKTASMGIVAFDLLIYQASGNKLLDIDKQRSLQVRLQLDICNPVRVMIVKNGPNTELFVASTVEKSGRTRPRMMHDVTSVLQMLGVSIFKVAPDFLDNLEMAFLVSGRDDEATKLRAFPLILREGAKAWYQTLAPEERRDWETLKTAFIEEFRHQEPLEEIWRQLLELRQTSPNDYRSYEGKFSNLWEKLCASLGEGERAPECLKKDFFLAGLYPILQEKVKVKFPDTFEKAMAYAREKDRKLKF
ncbi:hypothetical protein L7F22_023550 [Adiantum nelumboides]|nr:hypothetical protein [Adiantum nelumboides]